MNAYQPAVDFNNSEDFAVITKHLIAHARARLLIIVLLCICLPLSIIALVAARFTFGKVLTAIWLFSITVLLLIEKLPTHKECPKPWRFKIESPDRFLNKLESKVNLQRLPNGSGYSVIHYKRMTIYFLMQECSDLSRVSSLRKRLYRLIPDDSKPPKWVSIQNRLIQLALIVVESDSDGHLSVSIQKNAEQLISRTVPFIKMAMNKSSGVLYVPGIRENIYLGDVKEYYNTIQYILEENDH